MSTYDLKEAAVKVADADFALDRREQTVTSAVRDYWARVRGGELGALPSIFSLASLVILFTALRPETFLSERNIANLFVQAM